METGLVACDSGQIKTAWAEAHPTTLGARGLWIPVFSGMILWLHLKSLCPLCSRWQKKPKNIKLNPNNFKYYQNRLKKCRNLQVFLSFDSLKISVKQCVSVYKILCGLCVLGGLDDVCETNPIVLSKWLDG
jgi:hypothetical protein